MRLAKAVAIAGLWLCVTGVAPQGRGGGGLVAMDAIEPGEYALHESGVGGLQRLICVGDGLQLLQLFHPGAQCTRFVIANERLSGTVAYSCPGTGHGQTTISVETPRLFHISTQGLVSGAPFQVDYEARRIGPCGR